MTELDQLKNNYYMNINNIPDEMKKERRWIIFGTNEPKREDETLKDYLNRTGAKKPRTTTFQMASCNDSSTWSSFEECLEASKKFSGFGGIGFQLGTDKENKSSFLCIDIDYCLNENGKIILEDKEKAELVKDCLNLSTYNEISISKTGLHFFMKGEIASGIRNQNIEVYDSGRYIAMTGELLQKENRTIKEDRKALQDIMKKYAPEEIKANKKEIDSKSLIDSIQLDEGEETLYRFNKEAIQKECDFLNILFLEDYISRNGLKAKEHCLNRYDPTKHPHQDQNASMTYNRKNEAPKYYCHSCHQAFGVVDFVMMEYNITKKREAIEKTVSLFKGTEKIQKYYDFRRQIQAKKKKLQQMIQEQQNQTEIHTNSRENIVINEATGEVIEPEQEIEASFVSNMMDKFKERTSTHIYEPEETSFKKLNALLGGGFTKQSIVSIGGGTSTGKTTFTLEMIQEMMKTNLVIYYTLEMSEETILAKVLSNYISIKSNGKYNFSINDLLQGYKRTEEEREIISKYIDEYSETVGKNFIVYYPEEATIQAIMKHIEKVKKATGKKPFIVVDYLQFLQGEPKEDEASIIKKATRTLKKYTIENDTIAMLLFANNRETDKSKQASKISSGRSSSDIEYSSDYQLSIGFTEYEREESKKPDINELKKKTPRRMTITIQKNRTGVTGEQIDFLFYPETNKFIEAQKEERRSFFQSIRDTQEDEEEELFQNREAIYHY